MLRLQEWQLQQGDLSELIMHMAKKKDFIVTIGSPPQEHTAWTKPDDIVTIKKNQQIHNNTTLLKYWS